MNKCRSVNWNNTTSAGEENVSKLKPCTRDSACEVCHNCLKHCVQHDLRVSGVTARRYNNESLSVPLIDVALCNHPVSVLDANVKLAILTGGRLSLMKAIESVDA